MAKVIFHPPIGVTLGSPEMLTIPFADKTVTYPYNTEVEISEEDLERLKGTHILYTVVDASPPATPAESEKKEDEAEEGTHRRGGSRYGSR